MSPLAKLKALIRPQGDPATLLRKSTLRRQRLLHRLRPVLPWFRTALIVAGFVYLLALPWKGLGRGHYVSENALQPGQVNTYWNWADVHVADLFAEDVAKWTSENLTSEARAQAIVDALHRLGLPAAPQSYSYSIGSSNNTLRGTNVYSILQAPKTDGAEALVLSASWLSRLRDGEGRRRVNTRGVASVLALANFLKKYSTWSKDIIILISDGYSEGAQAWLDAYHSYEQTNLIADELPFTTGPIWAALNLDYPHHSFSDIGLFFEGANGHLPNLDFLNAASHILKHTGISPILHSDVNLGSLQPSVFASTPLAFLDNNAVRTFERAAKNLAHQLVIGATGRASGPEGVYGKYRIDALTFYGVPADGPHGFHSLGRAVESTFRSLNNLLERFHQSFFLYIMTSVETFVTVGNYLAAPVLVSAGMTVTGLTMWAQCADGLKVDDAKRERPVGTALAVVGLTHLVGAAIFAVFARLDPSVPAWPQLAPTLILVLLLTPLLLSSAFPRPRSTKAVQPSTILKIFNLILGGLSIAVVATLNFGAAVFLALSLCLPLTLATPLPSSSIGSKLQQVALVATSPLGLWSIWRAFSRSTAEEWLQETLLDWAVVGSWSLPFTLLVVVPLFLQAATGALL